MSIVDSGPLAALLNRNDQHHARAAAAARTIAAPMITTMACFTEAMYFLGRDIGWIAQARLWQLVEDGSLEVRAHSPSELARTRVLMDRCHDTPMDPADASLAESPGDSDLHPRSPLSRVPPARRCAATGRPRGLAALQAPQRSAFGCGGCAACGLSDGSVLIEPSRN